MKKEIARTTFGRRLWKNWVLVALVLVGSLSWSMTMVKSGLPTQWGLGFWGANGHDGIWHLALAESIKLGFPIRNPLAAGVNLTNYHWGFDFLLAVTSKITTIPVSLLYFQVLPPILAVLIGIFTYFLIEAWTKSRSAALWATFFTYFGGSLGWMVTFLRDRSLGGESLFWANQSISSLVNPPYALSLVVLIFGFWLMLRYPQPKKVQLVLQILIFGSLFFIKTYAGVIGLAGLFVFGVSQLVKEKRWIGVIRFLGLVIVSVLIIRATTQGGQNLLMFEPLWFPHTMVEASDRLFLPKLAVARQAYTAYGMWERLFMLEALTLAVFLLGNLGTRLIGLLAAGRRASSDHFGKSLIFMIGVAVVLPLVFVQKGTAWNTIQFFYYAQVLLGWLAGVTMAGFRSKLVLIPVVLLTLPTTVFTLWQDYLPGRPPAVLPFEEKAALDFLKTQPRGRVFAYPYEKPLPWEKVTPPVPLFRYESTAYISAFSGQPSYLADTVNLTIVDYSWEQRARAVQGFFSQKDPKLAARFFPDNYISYVYLLVGQSLPAKPGELLLTLIFENPTVRIYRAAE